MNGKPIPIGFASCFVAALAFLGAMTAHGTVLDNFNGAQRTAWEDANPGGLPLPGGQQADGKFTFAMPPVGQPYFVTSKKTSETFELREGRTIEFRADLINGQGPDSFAVLAFIPQATGPNTLAGYGIAKSETDILITKGINKYFYNENVNPPVKNNNVTLVLNLAVKGGKVLITGQVLDKDDGNRVIWEKSFVDTAAADVLSDGEDSPPAPWVNLPGNFVLYLYADGGQDPAGYQVVYDNAETFVTDTEVLDNFDGATRSGWEDANPAGLPLPGGQQANGVFTFNVSALGQPYFISSRKTTKTYELTEGTRHEFAVDMVSGQGIDSFVVLSWIPLATGPNTLAGYGFAKSESDALIIKGINKYFYNENVNPPVKNTNVRIVLTLTVQNGNVTVRGRILDKDDGDKILFDRTYVDTPAAEVMADGEDSPPAPYTSAGNVVLYLYADGGQDPSGYQVVYDNLEVSAPPAAANTPPSIAEISPATGANLLPSTTSLTFTAQDDQPIPDSGIKVVLNGTTYTTANGLTLGAAGSTRTASLGGFAPNTDYSGEISVTDAGGITRSAVIFFDTFTTTANRIVEVEDYNFESGAYFNNPVRSSEGGGAADNSYTDRVATSEIDFSDTRTAPRAQDAMYRTQDPIRMAHSLDRKRAAFDNDSSVWDYDVGDLATGEWMNYTRDFTAGTYEVYLREAVVNLPQADSVLERVTSDSTQTDQKVEALGSFLGKTSGFTFRNVPLTDGAGLAKVKLRLSGRTTLRLRTLTADTDGGNRLLNYLLFVPVADSGVQRPAVAGLVPAPNSTVDTVAPTIEATIQNRDTTVNTATIKLSVNGTEVTGATVTPSATGATVLYKLNPLPASGSVTSASLSFRDSANEEVRVDWQFTVTYASVDPASRLTATGTQRGFKIHVVQAPADGGALENSLDRAESQLANGSTIPRAVDTNTVVTLINFDKVAGATHGAFQDDVMVPGIDPDTTGNGDNDFAVEILTYLELPAGVHRFGVITDDGFKIATGKSPISASAVPLSFRNGGSADQTFDFVVAEAGFYPFRMVWYERAGAGYAEWFSVDPATGTRTLINDSTAAGAIKAWSEIQVVAAQVTVESSATVQGPYAADPTAVVNTDAKTVTVSATGSAKFYRLRAGNALTIKNFRVQGGNLVFGW
ncbi:MAG: hypothetical protein IT581_15395 [Verrucomicrobiales bacterium]|nr:hypothetical protein [Verrucomicrobiales bacterium]